MPTDRAQPQAVPSAMPVAALHARIAELEAENAALASQLRGRDQFLTQAAHELRNPMTPILGQVQLMRRQFEISALTPATLEAGLARLECVIQRYIRRATTLLDVSRIRAGRLHLRPVRVPLGPLMSQVVQDLRPQAVQAGATVTLETPEPITGTWDRLAVEQVLDNLLSNALKYGGGTPVTMSAQQDREWVTISVLDGGPGIPDPDQARIFDRFERGMGAAPRGGFGVGLWIVRELAAAMGGTVSVRSQPGAGAAFTVVLPLRSPEPTAP